MKVKSESEVAHTCTGLHDSRQQRVKDGAGGKVIDMWACWLFVRKRSAWAAGCLTSASSKVRSRSDVPERIPLDPSIR